MIEEAEIISETDYKQEDSDRINELAEKLIPDEQVVYPIDWEKIKTIKDIKLLLNCVFGAIPKTNPFIEELKPYLKKPMSLTEFNYYESYYNKKKKCK